MSVIIKNLETGLVLSGGGARGFVQRSFHLALNSEIHSKRLLADIFIEPYQLSNYGFLDIKKSKEIFKIGYEETMKVIEAPINIS